MKALIFDTFAGISGDMVVGSLLHLGVPVSELEDAMNNLAMGQINFNCEHIKQNNIAAIKFNITSTEDNYHARSFTEIKKLIAGSSLSTKTKDEVLAIFLIIASAEAKIHFVNETEISFHEIGALDSIADIVAAVTAISFLKPDTILSTPVPTGYGFVETAHGRIPVPAPATLQILNDYPIYTGNFPFETVTPTGAAIIKYFSQGILAQDLQYKTRAVGYGAGSRRSKSGINLLRTIEAELISK